MRSRPSIAEPLPLFGHATAMADALEPRFLFAAHAAYSITDLGTLGGPFSLATDINEAGAVVGDSVRADGTTHAFRTLPNQPIRPLADDLGTLGGNYSSANAIGPAGEVVGESRDGAGAVHAFYLPPNRPLIPALDDLGTFASPTIAGPAGKNSSAAAISSRGLIVGVSDLSGNGQRAFSLNAGQKLSDATDLGTLGGNFSSAAGVNIYGSIVGSALTTGGFDHAFRLDGNPTIRPANDMGSLAGSNDGGARLISRAAAVSEFGVVVGSAQVAPGAGDHAFRTSGTTIDPATDDLGTLGGRTSSANDVNADGDVVGKSALLGDQNAHAFLFPGGADGKMIDLNSFLPADSGWELIEARGINDVGQIVGEAITPSGETHAFLLSPAGLGTPDAAAPTVTRTAGPTAVDNGAAYTLELTYRDDRGINFASIDARDVRVRGQAGQEAAVSIVATRASADGLSRVITYRFATPARVGNPYTIAMQPGQVTDTAGRYVPATDFVQFESLAPEDPGGPIVPSSIDIAATPAGPLPGIAVAGDKERVVIRLTQTGGEGSTTSSVKLFASTDKTLDESDVALPVAGRAPAVKLSPGQTREIALKFAYPNTLPDGGYCILAQADAGPALVDADPSNNLAVAVAAGGAAVTVGRPFVDLTAALVGATPPAVVAGAAGTAVVRFENAGNFPSARPVDISLFASTDRNLSDDDVPIAQVTGKTIKLKAGGGGDVKIAFAYPRALPDGDYFFVARAAAVGATDPTPENNVAVSTASVKVAAPFVNLSAAITVGAGSTPATVPRSGRGVATIDVINLGNVEAKGRLEIVLSEPTADPSIAALRLGSLSRTAILKPGASKAFKVRFTLPIDMAIGAHVLRGQVNAGNAFEESDEGDNTASATFFVS